MRTLSNNRNNAIGPWYVYSNNGPSNANANNWGGRTPTQGGTNTYIFLYPKVLRMILNQSPGMAKLSKTDSTCVPWHRCSDISSAATAKPLNADGAKAITQRFLR